MLLGNNLFPPPRFSILYFNPNLSVTQEEEDQGGLDTYFFVHDKEGYGIPTMIQLISTDSLTA